MRIQPSAILPAVTLALVLANPASAQLVTTTEGLSLKSTVVQLLQPIASAPVGEAVAFATAIEIATTPIGTSSGGFVFKLDPTTGLPVRTATTFGPTFAERAITAGAGKMAVGATLSVATYDRLGDFSLGNMELASVTGTTAASSARGTAGLKLTAQTLVITANVGVTDNIDIGVAVPMVKVKLTGTSTLQRADGVVPVFASGGIIASGLGDTALIAKLRLVTLGKGLPDPGGLAVVFTGRLPTGEAASLRGLGIYRALGSLVFSSGTGKFRPHANAGFEWWEKGLSASTGIPGRSTVTARHQVQYAVGAEFEAAPKVTLLVDFLGRHILGGGRIDMLSYPLPSPNPLGVTAIQAAGITDHAIQKLSLAPGLKWNVKGNLLLSLSARIPVKDNSLYDKFTPVVGLVLNF